jgi:hypothetical protein
VLPLKEAIDMLSRPHEKVFLASVGPVAVKAAKQAMRTKIAKASIRTRPKRLVRRPPAVPTVHLDALDPPPIRANPFVKAIGSWIERIMAQPAIRRLG